MLLDGIGERIERGPDAFVRDACIAEQQALPRGVEVAVVAGQRAHDHARVERALRDRAIVARIGQAEHQMQAGLVAHHGQRLAEARPDRVDHQLPALAVQRAHSSDV